MDRSKDRVGILSSTSIADIDVCRGIVAGWVPESLKEAKDLWCND
jgi:hypothetical protein